MNGFQDPMNPWAPTAGSPGVQLEPLQETLPDPYAPLDSELLLQPADPAVGASYGLPQEQMESPLVVEARLAPLIEAGDVGTYDSALLAGADGGAELVPTTDAGSASVGEFADLGQVYETVLGQPSFSLGEIAEGLQVDYSPPPEVQVRAGEDEKPPTSANAPFQDEGWFVELRDSNRFRPGSEPSAPETHGRTYGQPRLSSVARPRVGGRSFNPFRRRASAQRCRRCGAKLFLGSRCERCGTDYCSYCSEALENGRCSNESCATAARDRCQSCGMEVCQCGI